MANLDMDWRRKILSAKFTVCHLNEATDFENWNSALRRIVGYYEMGAALLYSIPQDEQAKYLEDEEDESMPPLMDMEEEIHVEPGNARSSERADEAAGAGAEDQASADEGEAELSSIVPMLSAESERGLDAEEKEIYAEIKAMVAKMAKKTIKTTKPTQKPISIKKELPMHKSKDSKPYYIDLTLDDERPAISAKQKELMKRMGVSPYLNEFFSPSTKFINGTDGTIEKEPQTFYRHEIWNWMEQSLQNGVYSWVAKTILPIFDIRRLYRRICSIANKATYISFAQEFEKIFTLKPRGENIFQYHADLIQQIKIVKMQGDTLGINTTIPACMEQAMLLMRAWNLPKYKNLVMEYSMKGKEFTVESLILQLQRHTLMTNHLNRKSDRPAEGADTSARLLKDVKPQKCYNYTKGSCKFGSKCKYLHDGDKPPCDMPQPAQTKNPNQAKKQTPPAAKCAKCGGDHAKEECKFEGTCSKCGRKYHHASVCRSKARANLSNEIKQPDGFMDENLSVEMGGNARASIVIAKETPAQVNKIQAESLTSVDFIIDSGANRDICRDKYLFQGNLVPKQTVIGEASAGHVFTAEAEGAISLKLKGRPLPLFERAIYSENVTENIMSIPEAVDAGFTVVFDKHGVKFYDSGGITQNKLPLIQGGRSTENRLFYVKFPSPARKVPVPAITKCARIGNPMAMSTETQAECTPPQDSILANLASTYHEYDNDYDLWHGRLAHINPRLMQMARPNLKCQDVKHNCDGCTSGKIHRQPHSGKRPNINDLPWAPGEYLTCDLFGPLLRSVGGARYAAIYVDLKSRFVYVKMLKTKDDNYQAMVEVIVDAKARSGNEMRFLKTDGDGIFVSSTANDIYKKYKIRHILSAPGDSASNDVVERTIRTFAELTRANLLHANAPAYFWAEAMGYVEYVWNYVPALPNPSDKTKTLSRTSLLEGTQREYKLDHLRAFGSKCHYLLTVQKKGGKKEAVQEKGRKAILMGIENNMPACIVCGTLFSARCIISRSRS